MNKKIKVIIDDVELEVSVSEEELAKLTEKKKKKTGYERLKYGDVYYAVYASGAVEREVETNNCVHDTYYKGANYYTDHTLAENNARADKLMRQLRRFAAENCEEVEWDTKNTHYCITYDYSSKKFFINEKLWYRDIGQIYFDTKENAQKAIDTFKDELVWYFTEYRDRV